MRKYLASVVKISQMLPGNVTGTGQGGDRCEPTCAAMIDCTYQLGPSAKAGEDPEMVMQDIARWQNGGALSGPPEGPWLGDWLSSISNGTITLQAISSASESVIGAISAGNMIYAGIDDYSAQRLADGSNPYNWPENEHAGHVEIIAGYDDSNGFAPLLHDPLRGTNGQPAAYSWQSMLDAGLHLYRVAGPALPIEGDSMQPRSLVSYTFGQGPLVDKGLADVAADFDLSVEEIKSISQNLAFKPYDDSAGSVAGMVIALPGYPAPAPVVDTSALQGLQSQLDAMAKELDAEKADNAHLTLVLEQLQSTPNDLQSRLDAAQQALASAQQELAALKAQEPSDPVALQQRLVAALETIAQATYQMQRLIPPSAPKLP